MERSGATWRSLEQMEEFGGTWRSPDQHGKVRSNLEECREIWKGLEMLGASVEKEYVFYFNYKLESCPETIELLYKTSELPE